MDIDPSAFGAWPNVALIPGTHTHAATGEHVPQPKHTIIGARHMDNERELSRMDLGSIGIMDDATSEKDQPMKILEEAAEVYGAWQAWDTAWNRLHSACNERETSARLLLEHDAKRYLIEECVDVIQATANLLDELGVTDLAPYYRACEDKNISRGHTYYLVGER